MQERLALDSDYNSDDSLPNAHRQTAPNHGPALFTAALAGQHTQPMCAPSPEPEMGHTPQPFVEPPQSRRQKQRTTCRGPRTTSCSRRHMSLRDSPQNRQWGMGVPDTVGAAAAMSQTAAKKTSPCTKSLQQQDHITIGTSPAAAQVVPPPIRERHQGPAVLAWQRRCQSRHHRLQRGRHLHFSKMTWTLRSSRGPQHPNLPATCLAKAISVV